MDTFQKGINMLENFETLEALEKYRTMSQVGTALRVSQSAVSKRVAALEQTLQRKLIVREGRGVVLTVDGREVLNRVRPLLQELRHILQDQPAPFPIRLPLGISESILCSWGAQSLQDTLKDFPTVTIIPHTHRSPVVIDRVRSGEYLLGVCAGRCEKAPDLELVELGWEPFVIIQSSQYGEVALMTIEEKSETWASIAKQCHALGLKPSLRLESFSSMVQMAITGLVAALVPLGVVHSFQVPKAMLTSVAVARPVVLVGRRTTFTRPELKPLVDALKLHLAKQLTVMNEE